MPMSQKTLTVNRDPKDIHVVVRLFDAEYNKPRLGDCGMERQDRRKIANQFAEEEIPSRYVYPKGYKVKGIAEQISILRQLFPGIGFADEKIAEHPLPPCAEGWFAIPKWQMIAPTYGEAVEKVLEALASRRKFCNYRNGQLGPKHLRQRTRAVSMFQNLSDKQKDSDILVVPAQFGLYRKGRSVRRARKVFVGDEFGLGVFAVGIMMLTHPERLVRWEQLHVDCSGDEFALGADGDFSSALAFYFDKGMLRLDAYWHGGVVEHYGSASAFVPQEPILA